MANFYADVITLSFLFLDQIKMHVWSKSWSLYSLSSS